MWVVRSLILTTHQSVAGSLWLDQQFGAVAAVTPGAAAQVVNLTSPVVAMVATDSAVMGLP